MNLKILNLIVLVCVVIVSGCISEQTPTHNEYVPATYEEQPEVEEVVVDVVQPDTAQLDEKIDSIQTQLDDLQGRFDMLGIPTPSKKQLIPANLPFKISIKYAKFQPALEYTFYEGTRVEIQDDYVYTGSYVIDYSNNRIIINSDGYDFYGLVLYDDYITTIDQIGYIQTGFDDYKIIQKYDSVTRKYYV